MDGEKIDLNILGKGVKKVLLPGITAFSVCNDDPKVITSKDGIEWYDFSDDIITLDDVIKPFKNGGKLGSSLSELFKDDSKINIDVLNKLEEPCDINISIPEVYMPSTDMPVLRVA